MMMHDSFLCLCLCDSFNVFACGVCGIVCDAVWCAVIVHVIVVCLCVFSFMCSWVLCAIHRVVMYGLVLCVSCLCVSVPCFKNLLCVIDCVMLYGLFFVSCSMSARVQCVCVFL